MTMTAGITPMGQGMDQITWNILGQIYVPKQMSANSMSWHATLPPGTFVPPHIHPTQDEFLYILEGEFDFWLNGTETRAAPGDLVRLPMGIPHGIFNKTDQSIKCLFWVSPTRRLYDLFWALHNLGPTPNPADVVAISARHEVDFLPPPEES
jgi:quercetin dioxygenase-like cupin family protein